MSLAPTPTIYFSGIDYNPLFYQQPTGISLTYASQNYLSRIGSNPTSVALTTTFSGNVKVGNDINLTATNGLLSSNIIVANSASVYGNVDVYSYGQTNSLNLHDTTQLNVEGQIICTNTQDSSTINASAYFYGGMTVNKTLFVGNTITNQGQLVCVSGISSDTSSTTFINNLGTISIRNNGALYCDGNINGNQNIASKGNLYVYNTTDSGSYTSGALIVAGGVGIGKSLYVNGNISTNGNLSCNNFIATQGGFNGNVNLYSYSGTHTLYLHDSTNLIMDTGNLQTAGNIISTNTTDSISSTTGSIITQGGVGIAKNMNILGNIKVLSTTNGSESGNGSISTAGGMYIAKVLYMGNINTRAASIVVQSTIQSSSYPPVVFNYFTGGVAVKGGAGIVTEGNVNCGQNIGVFGNSYIYTDSNVFGNSYVAVESIVNDGGVNNNFAVSGVISCDKIVLGNCLFSPSITCNSLKSYGEIDCLNKIGAFINLTSFPFSLPISSSIVNITTCYTNLNLTVLLSTSCSVTLQPYYKINFTDGQNYVMATIDNTTGTSPLYANLPYPNTYSDYSNCQNIYLYYNKVLK